MVFRREQDRIISQESQDIQATQQQVATFRRPQDKVVGQQQPNQPTSEQLIDQLNKLGGLPLTREQQARAGVIGPGGTQFDIIQRQKSFDELIGRGFTRESIQQTLRIQRGLNRPRIGRTVGAIGATLVAGRLIPGPVDDAAILATLIRAALPPTLAGLGGVAGEATQTAIEERRLINVREANRAFLTEFATEGVSRVVTRTGKLLFSPFIKQTVPEAAALIDDFAKVGGTFSPTELDRRFTLRVGEAFARGSFGADQIFQEFEERQGKAALVFAKNIVDSIGEGIAKQSPRQIGETLASDISKPNGRVFNMLDELFDPLFKQVDDLAAEEAQKRFIQVRSGGPPIRGISGRFQPARGLKAIKITPGVSTSSLKKFATKELAKDNRIKHLSPTGRIKLKEILDMPDKLTFSEMRQKRGAFLKDVRKLGRDLDQSESIIAQLAQLTDDAIFDPAATRGIGPKALNLLRNTNAVYKASKEGIKEILPESLAKRLVKNPSSVVKQVIPNDNPKAIELLRKSLVEPLTKGKPSAEGKVLFNQIREAWLANAVDEATKEGVINPRTYNNILRKLGREGFEELFPEPSVRASVDKIQDLFNIAGRKPPVGLSLFSRGAQTIGAVKLWQGAKAGDVVSITSGGLLSIGPLAFAKLATNKKGIKFLTLGMNIKPGSSSFTPNAIRIVRLLREINLKENAPRQKELRRQRQREKRRQQIGRATGQIQLSPGVQQISQQLTGSTP